MFVLAVVLLVLVFGHMQEIEAGQVYVENFPVTNDDDGGTSSELHKSLSFFPSSLDFGEWSVGTAKSHIVTLVNKNSNRSVFLSSISGKTSTFYSSFFEEKVVPPQGNTTFNVVFLPRNYGNVETNLLIHTSFGQAILPVKGHGKECPYKLQPLVGIKAPFNSTLHMYLYMYNPHTNPIQILEVYSSGGQFQLELPSGTSEGPQALWEIPPLTTKPIIRIKFHSTSPGNHTAYIRIKISSININNTDEKDENVLMVPVECEILQNYGIYSINPIIDFGRLTTNDITKIIKLNLTNSGKDNYEIIEYQLKNVENFIKLDKNDLSLSLNPKLATNNYYINGELIIRSHLKDTPNNIIELSVAIKAIIFKGSLDFNKNQTVFITGMKNYTKDERDFIVENKFTIPIAVTNLVVVADEMRNFTNVFKIINFRSQTILPNEIVKLFQILIINETHSFSTQIRLETNLTVYQFPIVIGTGQLQRYTSIDSINLTSLQDEKILDFGTIPFGDFSHFGFILFKNPNPFPIQLMKWNFTNPKGVYYQSMFLGCLKPGIKLNEPSKLTVPERFDLCRNLSANDVAAFELAVQSFNVKSFSGTFKVWTEYEEILTTVKFLTVMGRLEIDQSKLHFSECFPGKRCSADISIHSTFLKNMRVNAITVSVPGLVFEYHTQNNLPEIEANSITDVGRIYFDPRSVCSNRCYIPQETDIDAPVRNENNLNFDEAELRRRTEMYRRFKWNLQTVTFTLNTSEVRLFEFNSTVDIVWPKLVRDIQTLPTIEVGQIYKGKIRIQNPSERPLLLDLNLSDPKKAKATSLSLPLEVVEICVFCYLTDEDVFHLGDRKIHLIKPLSFIDIDIKFNGRESGSYSTLLHIRNNLTLYEAVWITAKSVQPQFRFGNRKPGSLTPLLFEITEKHLTNCESSNLNYESISTKRTFTARNTGEVPIRVKTFQIGDNKCEGYGFKILDCMSFELKANASKKIDIAFTPDFTMARVTRPLYLKTNLSYSVNYTLIATIPPSSLEQCAKSILRPNWELNMQKMTIGMLFVAFLFVLVAAFFESDKILKEHVDNMSREKGPVQPPLDLRNVAMRNNIDKEESNSLNTNNVIESLEKPITNGNKFNNAYNLKRRTARKLPPQPQNSTPLVTGYNPGKEKLWTDELLKKSTHILDKSKDDIVSTLPSVTTNIASLIEQNGHVPKQHVEKPQMFTSTPKSKEDITTQKLTPPKRTKDINEKLNHFEKFEKDKSTFDKPEKEIIKKSAINNYENDKKNENIKFAELISTDNKKLNKISLKKSKSAPLPNNNNSSQDSSSNASSSPVNPKTIIEEKIIEKHSKKLSQPKEKSEQSSITTASSDKKTNESFTLSEKKSNESFIILSDKKSNESDKKTSESDKKPNESLTFSNANPVETFDHNSIGPTKQLTPPTATTIVKKYGKTPGRERKKENEKFKRSEKKVTKFKGSSLHFGSSTTSSGLISLSGNTISSNNNIWDPNQASFSHVVAQNISPSSLEPSTISTPTTTTPSLPTPSLATPPLSTPASSTCYSEKSEINSIPPITTTTTATSTTTTTTSECNEADLKNHETFGCDATEELKKSSVDLGPIGTRKSPSLTPVWEPLTQNIQRPTPNTLAMNNSSFFSSNFPIGNSFQYDESVEYLGSSSGLLDNLITQNNQANQWNTNDILMTLLQQQQLKQQQINANIPEWQMDNRTWTPMGYQNDNSGNNTGGGMCSSSIGWQPQQQQQAIGAQHQAIGAQHQAIDAQHQAIGAQHQAIGAQHQAIGGQHQAIGGQHQTIGGQHQAIGRQHQAIGGQHQTIGGQHQAICGQHKAIGGQHQSISGQHQALGAARYPPGLNGQPIHETPIHQNYVQQQQQQQQQLLLLQQQQQQQLQYQQNVMMHSNQQQIQMNNNAVSSVQQNYTNEQINNIQPFDPFSSLSAIWSDNWKNNNNNNQ